MSTHARTSLELALELAGADGLCNEVGGCGCRAGDLAPCEHLNLDGCVLAVKMQDGSFEPLVEPKEGWEEE